MKHVVLVDSRHYGYALRNGRKNAGVQLDDAAAALGLTRTSMSRIENGVEYLPGGALCRMMTMAYIELRRRYMGND